MNRSENGSTATVLLVLIAVVGGITLAVYFYSGNSSNRSVESEATNLAKLEDLKKSLKMLVQDPMAMGKTIERNYNRFTCMFSDLGNCKYEKGSNFLLYDHDAFVLSQLQPQFGMTFAGDACEGFPSEECPIHVTTSWKPDCDSIACEPTENIHVSIELLYDAGSNDPDQWLHTAKVRPILKLSAKATCLREGKRYLGGQCFRSEEDFVADSRDSREYDRRGASLAADSDRDRSSTRERKNLNIEPAQCPDTVEVLGELYAVDDVRPDGKTDIKIDSAQGCIAPDTYVFRCVQSKSTRVERDGAPTEGTWVQVDSIIAQCDDQGRPITRIEIGSRGERRRQEIGYSVGDDDQQQEIEVHPVKRQPQPTPVPDDYRE